MNILAISNFIEVEQTQNEIQHENDINIETMKWDKSNFPHRLDDFNVLILDLSFENEENINYISVIYQKLLNQINLFLNEQKIVVAICGIKKAVLFSIFDKDTGSDYEIDCYDILIKFFDLKMNLDIPGRCFKLNPGTFDSIQNYFKYVSEFSAIFEIDIQNSMKIEGVTEIATTTTTSRIISADIKLNKGNLIILPGYEKQNIKDVAPIIFNISQKYYQREKKRKYLRTEKPDWVQQYQIDDHLKIEDKIDALNEAKSKYDVIVGLLFEQHKALEYAIKTTFIDLGLEAKETKTGYTVDIFANYNNKYNFAIEVTGLKDKIRKKSEKMSQVWGYFLQIKSNEKILLIANTHIHLNLTERKNRENFTSEAKKLLIKTDAIFMTSVDLYLLWKAVKENKVTCEKVIESIWETNGEFRLDEKFIPII
jgi:hypothetical protein